MSELTDLYNPVNAKALTPEQVQAMPSFTNDQIEELAKAYPNQPRGNNYLVLINKDLPMDQQVFQLSTWNNLANLRRLNQNQFLPYSFQSIFNSKDTVPVLNNNQPAKVVDLSESDLTKVEGFKPSDVKTDPIISTEGPTPAKLVPTEGDESTQDDLDEASKIANGPTADYDLSDPDIKAAVDDLNDQKAKLNQLIIDKAHHMTIKAQETKVQDAQAKLDELTK